MNRDELRDATVNRLVKKGGLRARLDAFCCSCIFDPYSEGSWRRQVELCTSKKCPLYDVRPVSEYPKDAGSAKEK